jgi:uncharacterized DUF497 family protein
MPFFLFYWTEENLEHIEEHGVTLEEFEEIVTNPERSEVSRSTGRPMAIGLTSTGKYVACIYEFLDESTVYPITAYEIEE